MKTTAIYQNRIEDKKLLESTYGFPEFGSRLPLLLKSNLVVFSYGYERIVYGDHGPYIEFLGTEIALKLINKFRNNKPYVYYIWMHPVLYPDVKVYFQMKTVANLRNAPAREDGKPHRFNRTEGYADYIVGRYYVSPHYFKAFI